ncbi:MAG: FxLYD domain-containing protein [Bacteroidetes bacterium]|nr:FxLYD domain-containing protein [Bacteroidota bacterium]
MRDSSLERPLQMESAPENVNYRSAFQIPWRLLLLSFIGVFVLTISGCSEKESARNQVHVQDLRYRLLPGGARIITGKLVNDGEKPVPVVQIDVSLFDGNNRRISSMFVTVLDIEARSNKSFRKVVDSDLPIHGARVRSIIVP